jgi:hypothetical protein
VSRRVSRRRLRFVVAADHVHADSYPVVAEREEQDGYFRKVIGARA